MLVRYSIVELLMVFEVSAQREHTIELGNINKTIDNNMIIYTAANGEKHSCV